MKKTLYSIRHPENREPENGAAGPSKGELHAKFEKLLDDVEKNSVYIPVPERVKRAQELISRTVAAAGDMELDVDIERYDDRVELCFYDDAGVYCGELRQFFGEMFLVCDNVMMYPPKNTPSSPSKSHWNIIFTYYTHRRLVSGREINNFE